MPTDSSRREADDRRVGYVVPDGAPLWARSVLGIVFPGVFLAYLAQTAVGVGHHADGAWRTLGDALLITFGLCYLVILGRRNTELRRLEASGTTLVLFVAMIVCTLVVAPLAHEDVWMMYVFISVVAVAMFGHRGLIVAAGLTLVGMFLPPLVPSWHAGVQWSPAFTIPLVSLALFAFFAVVRANAELTEAKSEIARLATEGERNRIARDLHDLLGHSLTSITIKAGLARRLSATDADAAATEIAEVETLARGALADVRAAVGGYRDVTLASELATGREVLRAAGIEARFPGAIDTVEVAYRALFGWVVREGVTNVVRHSGATSCDITLGASWLAITDDGIGGDHASGNGLSGLRERVEAAGGRLESGARAEGGWRVRATMSAPEPPVDHDRAAMAAATTPELTR